MPDEAALTLRQPPQMRQISDAEYETLIAVRLFRREQKVAAKMAIKGESFLGIQGIMAQLPSTSPQSREPRRELNPRVAAKSKWLRIESIQRNKAFLCEYHQARKRLKAGDRDVVFPHGTYGLRIHVGVRCASG